MPESTVAPVTPPAPEAEAQATTATPPATGERHRSEDGRFAPEKSAAQAASAAPKRWKLGDREIEDPDELYALATQRQVDEESYKTALQKAQQAEMLARALKEGRLEELLGKEGARKYALEIAKKWKEEEEEKNLPPEERERRELKRKLEAYERERAEQEKKRKETEEQRLAREEGERAVATIKEAMTATGLPQTNALAKRVAAKMYANLQSGRNYPAHVIAKQVREEWVSEQREAYKNLAPQQLLSMIPELVEKLEALEDAGLLAKFPKLGDRLRRLNLQNLDARPAPVAKPAAPESQAARLPDGREPQTAQEWDRYFSLRAAGKL